jgi:hypothetical protein
MAYTFQATGDETEIYEEDDDAAVPVVLVPFLDSETIDAHRARVTTVMDALNAAPQGGRPVADELAEALRRCAVRALSANRIAEVTNVADLEDEGDTFEEVHQMANDLTIDTQRAFARRLGWLIGEDRQRKGVPEVGVEMFDRLISGNASDEDIAAAYREGTGLDLPPASTGITTVAA